MVAHKTSGQHSGKAKQTVAKKGTSAKPHGAAHSGAAVAINRREDHDRRFGTDRRIGHLPVAVEHRVLERRAKVNRRRQIDPTTCERDYSSDEIEFMAAIDEYKRRNGRMFPTCSEVLEVIRSLGYEKRPKIDAVALPAVCLPVAAVPTPVLVS